jgi:lysine 2,3-aminomutase
MFYIIYIIIILYIDNNIHTMVIYHVLIAFLRISSQFGSVILWVLVDDLFDPHEGDHMNNSIYISESESGREEGSDFYQFDLEMNISMTNFKDHLRKIDPEMDEELRMGKDLDEIRGRLISLLNHREQHFHSHDCRVENLERVNALNCIQVLKNFISRRNESLAGESVIDGLASPYLGQDGTEFTADFYTDILKITLGSLSQSDIYKEEAPSFTNMSDREAAVHRSNYLDGMAERVLRYASRYPTGLDSRVIERREGNRDRVLKAIGGDLDDWNDFRWQMRNVFKDSASIGGVIELTDGERSAIDYAKTHHIPFGVTPYYLALMDFAADRTFDHALRAQVFPTMDNVHNLVRVREQKQSLDFMMEGKTSPVELITRRYPMIAILKPFNSCAQICAYCQRNWELKDVGVDEALASEDRLEQAMEWFSEHPSVSEVLITGGDPALMPLRKLERIFQRLSQMGHVRRLRLGTRLPVVLPMRFDDAFMDMLASFHHVPDREVCLVTHIEHPYEVSPDLVRVVSSLRQRSLSVYNQQVFTYENSRRFETVALRLLIKQIGVDPYYTFNTKGKEETKWFRVPIARILQENKEEARLIPGLSRTDEPVFNIPGLGKNHLRAWQHHDLISLSPRGERIYEFHPWEKNIGMAPTYVYRDVPIADYLRRLRADGEDIRDYSSLWYYF